MTQTEQHFRRLLRAWPAGAITLLLIGCEQFPEISDYGDVCVETELREGEQLLVVDAHTGGCESDHEGARFECSITVDGNTATVETVFQDGKDPNDACNGELVAHCEVIVEPGSYTVAFDGETQVFDVPGGARTCLPEGSQHDD